MQTEALLFRDRDNGADRDNGLEHVYVLFLEQIETMASNMCMLFFWSAGVASSSVLAVRFRAKEEASSLTLTHQLWLLPLAASNIHNYW
jgi:hypothetical protein